MIYWGDETGISHQDRTGRSHAPGGGTPVVARTAKRLPQGPIAAVSNRGLTRCLMLDEGALDVARLLAFLRRLVKDARQKDFLIVDNLKAHHAKKVAARVASHGHESAPFYLPAYAPGHKPDEYLNNDLRQALRQKPQPAAEEELTKSARSVLRAIQRPPRRVRACFKPEPVRYAA